MKSGFLHAREDQKIDPEPKFHVPRSSNGKDYGGQPKRGQFLTLDHMGHTGPRLVIWENVIVADINETHEIFTYNLSLTEFNLQNEDK